MNQKNHSKSSSAWPRKVAGDYFMHSICRVISLQAHCWFFGIWDWGLEQECENLWVFFAFVSISSTDWTPSADLLLCIRQLPVSSCSSPNISKNRNNRPTRYRRMSEMATPSCKIIMRSHRYPAVDGGPARLSSQRWCVAVLFCTPCQLTLHLRNTQASVFTSRLLQPRCP